MTFLPRWVAQCWLEMENARVLGREWNTAQGEVTPSQSGECKIQVAQACTLWLELFWHSSFHNALKFHDSQLLGGSWRENLKLSFVNKSAHFSPAFPDLMQNLNVGQFWPKLTSHLSGVVWSYGVWASKSQHFSLRWYCFCKILFKLIAFSFLLLSLAYPVCNWFCASMPSKQLAVVTGIPWK